VPYLSGGVSYPPGGVSYPPGGVSYPPGAVSYPLGMHRACTYEARCHAQKKMRRMTERTSAVINRVVRRRKGSREAMTHVERLRRSGD
jgi:hypothetical protein